MGKPHYLLKYLPQFDRHARNPYYKNYTYNRADIKNVCIGLHTNIAVTSGYGERGDGGNGD
jgi:hypothetical protein